MKKVIVLVGPTASGKTKISIDIAKKFNLEVINGDSVQVYKELNIGSAKIKEEEKEGIIHHLFDFVNINDDFSVKNYQSLARNLIDKLKIPFIVGGTGLYIKSAISDYNFVEEKDDIKSRLFYENFTNLELYNLLKKKDPNALIKIHINNRRRLIRALEFIEKTNTLFSLNTNKDTYLYNNLILFLNPNRNELYDRINKRVDNMFDEGLLEEARNIYEINKNINIIGYKELFSYFNNEINLEEAKFLIKKNTRHYAKRQYTFFKNQFKDLKIIDVDYTNISKSINEIFKYIEDFL